jgi:hypothetical protein
MRRAIAGVILLVAICCPFVAQNAGVPGNESGRILSLENSWDQAEKNHDSRAMSMLVADPFDYTDDDGSYMNRAQWLAHIEKAVDEYDHLESSKMAVQQHGNVAIVSGMYKEQLREKGTSVMRSGRFTDTWIYQNGEWKCAASQSTLISN